MAYAAQTVVPVGKTKAEIEAIVEKYGARKYTSGWDGERALIMFECDARRVRFAIALPARDEYSNQRAYDQEVRRIWRALFLVIKAKLESISSGIETFDEAFLPQIVLPDNSTVADWALPEIARTYREGGMPGRLMLTDGAL